MTYHSFINWAIYTFAELGIADRLIHAAPYRGCTVEEIIDGDQQQWNSELLHRLLRTCVNGGIVESINDDKHYILTQSGMMMTSDHPSHARDHVRFMFGPLLTGASVQFHNLVRSEGTGPVALDMFKLLRQSDDKEFLSIYSGAMPAMSLQAGTKLVTDVDFGRFKTMVDLGGNRGTFLAQILENYPTIQHGIIFDLSHIINQLNNGEEFTSRDIHKDRWSFISGDMLDQSTIPLADAYTMAVLTDNARERTQDKYEEFLKKTGFEFKKLYPIQAPNSVIEAVLIH